VRETLVVPGTPLTLQNADRVHSAVGKHEFPLFDNQDVENVLSSLINVSDCTIPDVKRRKLTGRARFSVSIVRELYELHHTDPVTKQTKLERPFDSAIDLAKTELRDKVQGLLANDKTGDVTHLLGRLVLAYKLQGGKSGGRAKISILTESSSILA
jgi:hypothetical protein